ncbi:MAG: hypothetical protein KDA96_22880 [Planctomycetaceae bacterium]|nr:hypothetical protein [Planctomycetaceae bacterium]MCA9065939.1 hypothetical protein [Planctomycetaceae bacterium]
MKRRSALVLLGSVAAGITGTAAGATRNSTAFTVSTGLREAVVRLQQSCRKELRDHICCFFLRRQSLEELSALATHAISVLNQDPHVSAADQTLLARSAFWQVMSDATRRLQQNSSTTLLAARTDAAAEDVREICWRLSANPQH